MACIAVVMLTDWVDYGRNAAFSALKTSSNTRLTKPDNGLIQAHPLTSSLRKGKTLFKQLQPSAVGIDMVQPLDISHPLKRLYDAGFATGGVALGDIDGDGQLDIYISSGPRRNRLYRQLATTDGALRFEDITARAGVAGGDAWSSGTVMVDIDGDGDLDIYVCHYDSPNHLFVNDGKGNFVEQAKKFALDIKDACLFPAFADYDNDGDLDCYLLTNRLYRKGKQQKEQAVIKGPKGYQLKPEFERYYRLTQKLGGDGYTIKILGRRDYLLRNEGGKHFKDVTREAGIEGNGVGNSVTWCDFNRDGWIDIYVANDGEGPDHLYANNGKGAFYDMAPMALPHTTWFSMGSEAGDLNNDGELDLFVLDMSSTTHYKQKTTMRAMNEKELLQVSGPPPQLMRNTLLLNSPGGRFREAAELAGLADSDWSWAPKLADFDNDGRMDIFISNGVARNFTDSDQPVPLFDNKGKNYWDYFEASEARPEKNLAYRNKGELVFDDVSAAWGLDHTGMSYASASGDLNNDGKIDLVVLNLDDVVSVYQNQSHTGHRVVLRLKGLNGNTYGLGASVSIKSASGWQIRQLSPMTGFLSSNDPRIHFGLGADTKIERLLIQWPGGTVQTFTDLVVDQLYTITQSEKNTEYNKNNWSPPFGWSGKPLYRPSYATVDVSHRENDYNDFSKQPLLPNKLSRLGPGLAIGDVNDDGQEDLFIAGAAGRPGKLFLNKTGHYVAVDRSPFFYQREAEDMGAVFFDADGDNDLDLYVVSGGYEFGENDKKLRDRLYLNDGHANFELAAKGVLPESHNSGSCVLACDFDRDGDLDLFIGGRVIPGRYPLSPQSQLLRNDSNAQAIRFTDVTDELAPGLRKSGLVTSALWSDSNNDGWLDLLVVHEWGLLKVFRNIEGKLVDYTKQAGTSKWKGWWNGIAGRDVDGDGDIDYVVTNFGLNTKYHASQEKPTMLYYGDFDGSGNAHLVEAEYEGKTLFPVRGKSCSTNAMPHLGKIFKTYHDFARAELKGIYKSQCLDDAHKYEATTLETALFLNDGSGHFSRHALPRIVQVAPAFGVVLTEINGDGHPDLYLVQNFSSAQAETGPMNGGLSQALLGQGDGQFVAMGLSQSRLLVTGDSRSLVLSDINGDHWPDLVVGINDQKAMAFQHLGFQKNRIVQVQLEGARGNKTAVGAKVSLELNDGHTQTAEVYAGDGYLSQSSAVLSFGIPNKKTIQQIRVRWPDGVSTRHKVDASLKLIVIKDVR